MKHQKQNERIQKFIACLLLTLTIMLVYGQVARHDFINFDDNDYVTQNIQVRNGISRAGIAWAFTSTLHDHWHPLTWLSHMLDCQLFGLNAAGHHLTSLLFHILNALLLYFVLKRLTKTHWQSLFAAAFFALHPLNVESVAWVAERKNVLSTFFALLTILTYTTYVKRAGLRHYFICFALFTLGLLSKSILVTLPVVLLLLDFWPLERLKIPPLNKESFSRLRPWHDICRLLLEKTPFFIISLVVGMIVLIAHQGRLDEGNQTFYSLSERLSHIPVLYTQYMAKMIWPVNLAILYPAPDDIPVWYIWVATVLMLSITAAAIRLAVRWPYLLTGWMWFVITLAPVSGLIQTGPQNPNDRYAYISLIGLFIALIWGITDLSRKWHCRMQIISILAGTGLGAMMIFTGLQAGIWQDSLSLFSHTVKITPENELVHLNLGNALKQRKRYAEAERHYRKALQIKPAFDMALYNLGNTFLDQGNSRQAVRYFFETLQVHPGYAPAHLNLGIAMAKSGNIKKAEYHLTEATKHDPGFAKAFYNLALFYDIQNKTGKAKALYLETLKIDPHYRSARIRLQKNTKNNRAVNR